jgi:hypothetical protein
MPKAPEWFLKELEAFDSDLRVRWSARTETFHLERRVTRSLHPGTIRNDHWHDDFIRAQDGYLLVGVIRPGMFSRSIFDKLRASDLWSNGGWLKMAQTLEEFEEAEEELKWAQFSQRLKDETSDLYELMKMRDGRSVFNAGWVSQ